MKKTPFISLYEFKKTLPPKPKVGIYIDDSNLYKRGKATGWLCDYKKILDWVSEINEVKYARVYKGKPKFEPEKGIAEALERYYKSIGYSVTTKDLKRITDSSDPKGYRNKCNFDIEMHDEIMEDLNDLDIVYIFSGDSDFLRTKEKILQKGKRIKFIAYEKGFAWELRASWHITIDSIREFVERNSKAKNAKI
jgi:uncharacterized LabA/DUF88 family protein